MSRKIGLTLPAQLAHSLGAPGRKETLHPTQAELLATLKAISNGQQNILCQGYNAYSKHPLCFWVKHSATKADVQALMPAYVTEIAPGQ